MPSGVTKLEPYRDDDIDCPREIQSSVPEHQILLSFNDDALSVMFFDWWNAKGQSTFLKLANARKDD